MINLEYLTKKLLPLGYQLDERQELPVFFKKILHRNGSSIYAFTIVLVTLDIYTVTVEGLNEILIARAVAAKALEINSFEELDALREIVYDNTFEDVKHFEARFDFFEKQLEILVNTPVGSDEQEQALEYIALMVTAAKANVM